MNCTLSKDCIGGLFGLIFFAIALHYVEKSFLKDKLKRKAEFEKFVAENGKLPKMDYNHKKYLMSISAIRYRQIIFIKWIVYIFSLVMLYKIIS